MSINHEAAALDYIAAANTTADTLDELLEARDVPDRNHRVAEAHRRIGHALKLAHIHAQLATAQALTAQLASAGPVVPTDTLDALRAERWPARAAGE